MATRMGARAIHQPQLGVLAPGYQADVLLLTLADTTLVPVFEDRTYIDHLVYASGRELVDSVWVNGVRVVKADVVLTVDEAAARRRHSRPPWPSCAPRKDKGRTGRDTIETTMAEQLDPRLCRQTVEARQ